MHQRRLGIKIDEVAMIRQMRRSPEPDPVIFAALAEIAGASQITTHLREDRRYVQERDVRLLKQTLSSRLNLEMAGTHEMLQLAYDIKPDQVTLVPESRDDNVGHTGLDINLHRDHLRKYVQSLRDADITVSLSIDPDLDQVRAAHRIDATHLALFAGRYTQARGDAERRAEQLRLVDAARAAVKLGMRVSVNGGLNYENVRGLVAIDEIDTFTFGHSMIARAMLVGIERAVRDMRDVWGEYH